MKNELLWCACVALGVTQVGCGGDYAAREAAGADAVAVQSVGGEASAPYAPPSGGYTTTASAPMAEGEASCAADRAPFAPHEAAVDYRATQALLTAASVSDADRRQNYLEFLGRHPLLGPARLDLARRVRFHVVDGQNRPVNDATITVATAHAQSTGRTHADGGFDLYPGLGAEPMAGPAVAQITALGQTLQVSLDIPQSGDGQELVVRFPSGEAVRPRVLDLAFVIDVTGSMEDELRYVNREIAAIVQDVHVGAGQTTVRVGATFYRDREDDPQVEQIPFTTDIDGFARAMQTVHASGGGDYPEDLDAGLDAAMHRLEFSQGNAARVVVLVADAPPQRYRDAQYTHLHAMRDASERGIRIVPVAASGADRTVEYLFRAMGAVTSTPYVYLTDDSGIGGSHLEADTDRVGVEHFRTLLSRMLVSDLAGHGMHEPSFLAREE